MSEVDKKQQKLFADLTQLAKETFGVVVNPAAPEGTIAKGQLVGFYKLTEDTKKNWVDKVGNLFEN